MHEDKQLAGDYCIEIDYERDSLRPERIFSAMANLLSSFQQFDNSLSGSLSADVQAVLILRDIQSGSVRVWINNQIKIIDKALSNKRDCLSKVGNYLGKGKRRLLDFIKDRNQVDSKIDLEILNSDLFELAKATDLLDIPTYSAISPKELAMDLEKISLSVIPLLEQDKVQFYDIEGMIPINKAFRFQVELSEELLTEKRTTFDSDALLTIKRPDYLGNSMWDLRRDGHPLVAHITDQDWIDKFRSRVIPISPGDALHARLRTETKYDSQGEVLSTGWEVIRVFKVVTPDQFTQEDLPFPGDDP